MTWVRFAPSSLPIVLCATALAFGQAAPGGRGGVFSGQPLIAEDDTPVTRRRNENRRGESRREVQPAAYLEAEQLPPGNAAAGPSSSGYLPMSPPTGSAPARTAAPINADAIRLPPIEAEPQPLDPYFFDEEPPVSTLPPGRLNPYKNGFFQKLSVTGTWLPTGRGNNDLGVTEVDAFLTVALPFPIVEWPLLISPTFNTRLLSGQHVSDLPPQLYETFVDFMWVPQFLPRLKGLLAVTPSLYTDFQHNDPEAFRVQGKALLIYDYWPDQLQIVGGLLYLDRADVIMLPAGGVIWTPTDWLRWEVIFPKPRLASRFNVGYGFEDWIYVTCEWGGSTYSIERLSGLIDRVTWQDFRLLAGVERKLEGGAGYRLEAGYVIGRSVKYTSGLGDFDPPNTFLVRGAITF